MSPPGIPARRPSRSSSASMGAKTNSHRRRVRKVPSSSRNARRSATEAASGPVMSASTAAERRGSLGRPASRITVAMVERLAGQPFRGESVGDAVDRHLHVAQHQDARVAEFARLPGAGGGFLRRLPRRLEELPTRVGTVGRAEVAKAAQALAERLRRCPAVHAVDVSGA